MLSADMKVWMVISTLVVMVILLITDKYRPSLVFIGGVTFLIVCKILSVQTVAESMANTQLLTIFLIIFLSSIIQQNFNLNSLLDKLFSGSKGGRNFLFRMSATVAILSSVFNNTPIVIMFMPYVYRWSRRFGVAPSRLLMPLSFAAILGGMITLVGTSTNLVLNGFLESYKEPLLTFSDFFYLGVILTVFGIAYMYFWGYDRLQGRATLEDEVREHARQYFVEVKLRPGSKYVGQTISETKIRKNKGMVLLEIIRGEKVYNVISSSSFVFNENDRLLFSGKISEILELVALNDELILSKNAEVALADELKAMEVTLPPNSPLEGVKIKDSNFRKEYKAAIIAIHRNGEQLSGRIGEVRLRKGDLLLLVTDDATSVSQLKKDFYLLSTEEIGEVKSGRKNALFIAGVIIGFGLLASGSLDLFTMLLILVSLALVFGLTTLRKLKSEVDFNLLAILISALALGDVFISSGAASLISEGLLNALIPYGVISVLVGLMLFTLLLTTFVTNIAAVSVAFPLAYSISKQMEMAGEPFYLAVAFMASASFLTPISYQTNLIVAGPGGYKFKDFLKIGSPLTVLYFLICTLFICLSFDLI